jgi:hypothetical protein
MVGPHTKNAHFKDSKKVSELKPMGSRPLERPRIRWPVLKVRNWKELTMDRKAWSDLFENAKTHKGL